MASQPPRLVALALTSTPHISGHRLRVAHRPSASPMIWDHGDPKQTRVLKQR